MSRHRDIRNRAYSYDDEYDYDEEEEYAPNSPNTNEFMYRRESPSRQRSMFTFVDQTATADSATTPASAEVDDAEILQSLLPFVTSVVGSRFSEAQVVAELRLSNYDTDRAVVSLLESAKTAAVGTSTLPISIPIPRLDAIAMALDAEQPAARPTVPSPSTGKSVTAAIGSTATVAPKKPKDTPAAPSTSATAATTAAAAVSTAPAGSVGVGQQTFSPSELKSFAKAEERAQQVALAQYEQEAQDTAGKTRISMVVVGHVDAGKSTITGHLLFQLGCVSQRVMHKYEKESRQAGKASFAYAWVMDADEEERTRGVTMDIGTSFFETKSKRVTLLDAPGHRDFIPKMIAGAAQADVALLVVPAATGEFEAAFENSGQTKEHTLLVRSLGVTQLVVAVNKMDAVQWNQDRFNGIVASLSTFLQSAGFRPKHLTFVPVSGMTGINLQTRVDEGKDEVAKTQAAWYTGPTLVDAIDAFAPPQREISKPFRMCVSDVAKSMSLGQTISGRVYAGAASVGDTLMLMPVGQTLTIKGIEQNGSAVTQARAGDTLDLGVTNIDPAALSTGSILCSVVSPVRLVRRFEAKIMTMPAVEVPLVKGTCLTIHVHNVDEPVNVTRLVSLLAKSGEVERRRPRCITREKSAVVQITCQRPLCLEMFTQYRQLGRFTLRDRGATLAAGIITEILQ